MRHPMLTHFLVGGVVVKRFLILWIMLTMFLFSCTAESETETQSQRVSRDTYSVWADDNETIEEIMKKRSCV